jgi:predicted transcriptional regulator
MTGRPILLSVHPEYARLIFRGTKRAELRRTRPQEGLGLVLVYETAPVSKITGWFTVNRIETASQDSVWNTYREQLAISHAEFRRYVAGCPNPTILGVGDRRLFPRQLGLRNTTGLSRPPQSYCYLDTVRVEQLIGR